LIGESVAARLIHSRRPQNEQSMARSITVPACTLVLASTLLGAYACFKQAANCQASQRAGIHVEQRHQPSRPVYAANL
jgi:hypothetical protein